MSRNRSRKIDLIVSALVSIFENIVDIQVNTRLDTIHEAAIQAEFKELVSAIELYWQHQADSNNDLAEKCCFCDSSAANYCESCQKSICYDCYRVTEDDILLCRDCSI